MANPAHKPPRPKARPKARKASRGPFLRVLPLLILAGGLMLTIRINDIRKGFVDLSSVRVASELQAQDARGQTPPAPVESKPGEVTPAGNAAGKSAPPPAAAPAAAVAGAEQANLTPTEMDVLQKLADRRTMLDGRERDVERREAMLKAAESQIDRKISEMKTLQGTIEGLLRQYNEQEDSKMRSLVKIYENMKPKDAARIFEQLDMGILLEVVERMKEQRVAPVLAEMDPSKARLLTSELAQRRQMPMPKPASGG